MPHWKITDEATQATVAQRPTLEAAEAWIAEREKLEPEKVHAGGYGIDGPCPNPGEAIVSEGGDVLLGKLTDRQINALRWVLHQAADITSENHHGLSESEADTEIGDLEFLATLVDDEDINKKLAAIRAEHVEQHG